MILRTCAEQRWVPPASVAGMTGAADTIHLPPCMPDSVLHITAWGKMEAARTTPSDLTNSPLSSWMRVLAGLPARARLWALTISSPRQACTRLITSSICSSVVWMLRCIRLLRSRSVLATSVITWRRADRAGQVRYVDGRKLRSVHAAMHPILYS